jgi:hypothetical protein
MDTAQTDYGEEKRFIAMIILNLDVQLMGGTDHGNGRNPASPRF